MMASLQRDIIQTRSGCVHSCCWRAWESGPSKLAATEKEHRQEANHFPDIRGPPRSIPNDWAAPLRNESGVLHL